MHTLMTKWAVPAVKNRRQAFALFQSGGARHAAVKGLRRNVERRGAGSNSGITLRAEGAGS